MSQQRREVEWTDEQVARFWDWMSNDPAFEGHYFADMVGDQLIALAQKHGLGNSVLDFGCGPGYLLQKLSRAAKGFEFSEESARKARERSSREVLTGTVPSNAFDFVFFIETIEHLTDAQLRRSLSMIRDSLIDEGTILVTTPYAENLGVNKTMCPDCGAVFHRMQHVRSWNEKTLRPVMEQAGFETVAC